MTAGALCVFGTHTTLIRETESYISYTLRDVGKKKPFKNNKNILDEHVKKQRSAA